MSALEFKDIENLDVLKRFQNILYDLLGLGFEIKDIQSHESPYFSKKAIQKCAPFCCLIQNSTAGRTSCLDCDSKAIKKCLEIRKPYLHNCHLGLKDITVPLSIQGSIVGFLVSGQFLSSKPTESGFKKIEEKIRGFGVDAKKAKEYYMSLSVFSREKIRSFVALISVITEYISGTESEILKLKEVFQDDKIRQAQVFIESYYQEKISLNDVAKAVNLSPFRLIRLFREKLGTSSSSYINNLRIEKAKVLLSNTNLKIIEVAYRVGFKNLSHFNHTFKEKVGLAPRKYRRSSK